MRPTSRRSLVAVKRAARRARPGWYVSARRLGGFSVVHLGRCGSTVLGDLLSQHPQVSYDGETYGKLLTRVRHRAGVDHWKTLDLLGHLDGELHVLGPGWVGFDYLPWHVTATGLSLEDHADALRDRGFDHVILLRRNNYLKRLVSKVTAAQSHVWHDRGSARSVTAPLPVRINVSPTNGQPALLDQFSMTDAMYVELERLQSSDARLTLSYEDDIEQDPTTAYRRVTAFLGLPPTKVQVRLQRLAASPLLTRIENYGEVAEALAGTRYEWMLDD